MEVTLIEAPKYTVNFSQFLPAKKRDQQLQQRVYTIGVEVIKFFGVVISSLLQAGYLTLRYAVSSFVRLVFDSLKITDFYLGAFKIAYWAFSMGFTFVATAARLIIDTYSSSNELFLAPFIAKGIDLLHIQTKGIQLDTSEVLETIKVADLLTLFEEINFTDPHAAGYMPPTTRREGNKSYSVEELRENLGKFVENVDGRVAFLGTPPAHDTVCLNAFYQQIEDAVRLSLHKVTQDLETFKRSHPKPSDEGEEIVKQHKNLLEDQARLILDLAIAGNHCGARYMGEAMSSYFGLYGEAEPSGTLKDTLIELLAAKRNEVAQGEIQKYFGASTHGFSQYMQHMGGLLAIPGTENVIEHLSGSFDYTRYLKSFFEIYTEDFIIDAIQEKIKKSQPFREQIIDWLKLQVGTAWRPSELPDSTDIIRDLKEVMEGPVDATEAQDELGFFIEMLGFNRGRVHSLDEEVPFPNLDKGWSDFTAQLFALDEVKAAFNEKYSALGLMDRMRKRQALIQKLGNGSLGKALEAQYREREGVVLDQGLNLLLSQLETVRQMKPILPIEEEVLLRVLQGKAQMETVVHGYLQEPLQSHFLYALNIGNMTREGLSPVMLEWLLDAHHVFVPKNLEGFDHGGLNINPNQSQGYRRVIDPDGNVYQMQTGRKEEVREFFIPFLKNKYTSSGEKRYIFGAETDVQEIALQIFETAFKERTYEVIQAAETLFPQKSPFHPRWKEVVYIKVPEVGAAVFGNTYLKLAISAYLIFKLIKLTREAYEQSGVWANRFHRYVTKEAPSQVIEAYRYAYKAHQWVCKNKWKMFIYGWLAKYMLSRIHRPLAKRVAKFIDPSAALGSGGSYFGILLNVVVTPLTFGWKTSTKISSILQYTADRSKQERLTIQKRHCYFLWNRAIN